MHRCIVHGWVHYPGETDSVDTVGDELDCRTEEWPVIEGEVISSQCEQVEAVEDGAFFVLSTGDLAYLDTFGAGLVPCKVTALSNTEAEVKVTAGRPGWKRGESLTLRVPNLTLVNRNQVSTRRGQYRITGPLRLYTDEGDLL